MYEPSKLTKTFLIAGFKNYDGPTVLGKLKPGKRLNLVPEPDNPYDPNAIALHYKKTKLGFVPRGENELMALMFHYGHNEVFEARVLQVNPEADPWKQVLVGIYVTDARKQEGNTECA